MSEPLDEEHQKGGLGDAGQNANVGDVVGHVLLREAHDELQVDEEARELASLREVGEEDGDAEERDRPVREDGPQGLEWVDIIPADCFVELFDLLRK